MLRNLPNQKVAVYAYTTGVGSPKTGDAPNITCKISKEGEAAIATNDVNPTELDAANTPGVYIFDMTQAESNAHMVILSPSSITSQVIIEPLIIYTHNTDMVLDGTSPNTNGDTNTAIRIELNGDASDVDGAYDPAQVQIVSGTGAPQIRDIYEYDGANKLAYISRDWKTIPDDTSEYHILQQAGHEHVNEGLTRGGGASTVTLNTLASSDDNAYKGQTIFLVAGVGQDQAAIITAYDGESKVATIERPWVTQPTNGGTVYAILPSPAMTIEEITDAVWDEKLTAATHNISASAARRLREIATNVIVSGTSPNTDGTANTAIRVELNDEASSVDGNYDPANILVYEGMGAGQSRQIWEYDGINKYAYISRDWKVIPDNTSKYIIYGSSGNTHINEGLCGGGTSTTIILNTLASDEDDTYNGQVVFLAAGVGQDQSAVVTDYDGATHIATIERPWAISPIDGGTVYSIIPMTHSTVAEIRAEIDANSTQLAAIKAVVDNIVAVAPINVSHTSNVVHRS